MSNIVNSGLAKITGYSAYGSYGIMPINILKSQKFFSCRNFKDFNKWYLQRSSKWCEKTRELYDDKINNKNIIVAGFSLSVFELHENILNTENFPSMENIENLFLVENSEYIMDIFIQYLKKTCTTNPNIYIIDVGISIPPLPDGTIKTKLNDIKTPIYCKGELNKEFYVDTQKIIDFINDNFVEEDLMLKE